MMKLLSILTLSACLLVSCNENNGIHPSPTGEIWGRLQVLDVWGNELDDKSGVRVSLDGTSYSTLSAADGIWRLKNVPQGVYNIHFAKPGYGLYVLFNIQFVGSGQYYFQPHSHIPPVVQEIPSWAITQQTMEPEPDKPGKFRLSITLSETMPHGSSIGIFYKLDPNSPFDYKQSRQLYPHHFKMIDSLHAEIILTPSDSGLPSGSTLYIQSIPMGNWSVYSDIINWEVIISGVNESGASETIAVTIE